MTFKGLLVARSLLVVAAVATVPRPATAGCLLEYDGCSGCAQRMLWEGTRTLNPSLIREANLYQADCSIDLWHCMMFGSHHTYRCRV